MRLPRAAPAAADTVVALELEGEMRTRSRAAAVHRRARRTRCAPSTGGWRAGLQFGAGKTRDAWVHGWTKPDQSVRWPVRLRERAAFDVSIAYDAPAGAAGTFVVRVGAQALKGTVQEGLERTSALGRVTLEPGAFEIAVEPVEIKGQELMRLRGLTLALAQPR